VVVLPKINKLIFLLINQSYLSEPCQP